MIRAIIVLIFGVFVFHVNGFELELHSTANADNDFKQKCKKAKTFKRGDNLAIVIVDFNPDRGEFGFTGFEFYADTRKLCKVAKVSLKNTSDNMIEVDPTNFKVTTKNGYTLPIHEYTYNTIDPFPLIRLEPGTKTEGFIVFALSEPDVLLDVIYDDLHGNKVSRPYIDAMILGLERSLMQSE